MPVEDVFSITGRGTVATGRIDRGKVKVQDEVEMVGFGTDKKVVVTGVEMFRKLLDDGQAGDNVGLLLRGVEKTDVERGMVLAKPGSITPHTQFEAEVYVLTKEEGGRHTPFFKGYRPQFYLRTTDVTGTVELPAGGEMVMPGDNTKMTLELITPIAMEDQLRFAIREGGRTVGAGVVTKILKYGADPAPPQPPYGVPGVQEPELLHHEEPAQAPRTGGVEEVLPALQQAAGAQGIEVGVDRSDDRSGAAQSGAARRGFSARRARGNAQSHLAHGG